MCIFSYHTLLIGLMSYVGIITGAIMAYPVVGQYTPASYCQIKDITDSGSADYEYGTSGSADFGSADLTSADLASTGFKTFPEIQASYRIITDAF